MPLQNRVTPFGEIIATPTKGLFMGNRGRIHGPDGKLGKRAWAHKSWVTCRLAWKGINRIRKNGRLMSPNSYTELFFLDEATALAAGHRPCNECRKDDLGRFKAAWVEPVATVAPIDERLHRERIDATASKFTWTAAASELPDGAMLELPSMPGQVWLAWKGKLLEWSPGGYVSVRTVHGNEAVNVLTPPSMVGVIRNGYKPVIHPSAEALV